MYAIRSYYEERGGFVECDLSMTLDWDGLRKRVQRVGMRNSNCLAVAPTATIANITGLSQSIEPVITSYSIHYTKLYDLINRWQNLFHI